jgi:superfamily II DNA or RNA helicase
VGLRDRVWCRFLRGPDQTLLEEFYEPALREALRYDRSCAYFSSSVLAAAARGFGPFIERLLTLGPEAPRPAMRLLVNEELSRDDVAAILEQRRDEVLAQQLLGRLREPADELERDRLGMLAFLVQEKLLDIRVGLMRHGHGILHAKFGIVTDREGDSLVFNGSGNESASGLTANYEKLELSTSWQDVDRFRHFRAEFDALWADLDAAVTTIPLPEAVRLHLIRFVPTDGWTRSKSSVARNRRRRHEIAMRWRFAVEAPYFPQGQRSCDAMAPVSVWPHQLRVVEEAASAWPGGRLLCDEVGMGKTVEAIMVLRRLLAGRGVRRALLLVPAGILRQWQDELREKGGLVVPRLEGPRTLVWPEGKTESVVDLAAALAEPLLLVSRELARLDQNIDVLFQTQPWDLVLLDEAHAARRAKQEEREFNSATRLLDLVRRLQLLARTRGFLLLSATPMQTHPWEPWDLLSVLGEGAPWLRGDFGAIREFYRAVAKVQHVPLPTQEAQWLVQVVTADAGFTPPPGPPGPLVMRLSGGPRPQRERLAQWLRASAPLGRRMHRNTRATLRRYHAEGLIDRPPPKRAVQDAPFDFIDTRERDLYEAITNYVNRRFEELEAERPGKGFVMTVYRRRASSCPFALGRSLARRADGLRRVIAQRVTEDAPDLDSEDARDFEELLLGDVHGPLSSALPEDPKIAAKELEDVQRLLAQLQQLIGVDSKLTEFLRALEVATDDGRPVLVFSEFTDTVSYLRDKLFPKYGAALGCYTGRGGQAWLGDKWIGVSKEDITDRLEAGGLRVLLCSDAASEGLNLQAAGALINYDLPWNPSRVEQRIGRIDRIGQEADVIRVINLVLRDSVDERVYQVLDQRCQLFQHFVGAMQPVLAEARQMLLGLKPFSEEILAAVEQRVRAEAATLAAFEETQEGPPPVNPPGATLHDLARAFGEVCPRRSVAIGGEERPVLVSSHELANNEGAWPLSPLVPEVRRLGEDLVEAGELVPLVIGTHEDGGFRVAVAVWVGHGGDEVVDRIERLEALLGRWDGGLAEPRRWIDAEARAKCVARESVEAMIERATREERVGLERQVAAAKLRLARELGRFLLCLVPEALDLNQVFHEQQARNIASADRLRRAHALIGYPEWAPALVAELRGEIEDLTVNQRRNVIIGSPLDAALNDPRWQAAATLQSRFSVEAKR